MHGDFLLGAGLVLALLALAGIGFERLGQSSVPAFLLVGVAIPAAAVDQHLVDIVATTGVVLLLFLMGLEFSLPALLANRRRIVRAGLIDLAISFPPGLAAGLIGGWGWGGGLLLGGALYASSSAIVAKGTIDLQRAADPETETALGILVFEDLFLACFLAVLSGALLGKGGGSAALIGIGTAVAFLVGATVVALAGRKVLDRVLAVRGDDLFLLLAGAIVLLLSWAALRAGLSEAIGAFLAGLVLAETRHRERAEEQFLVLQGLFGAVFFFGFGLSVDVQDFRGIWLVGIALALVCVAAKVAVGMLAGKRDGLSPRNALALGLTLVPRGEFSILIAGVAAAAGMEALATLIALVVLLLALAGTVTMRYAPQVARRVYPPKSRPKLELPSYMRDAPEVEVDAKAAVEP